MKYLCTLGALLLLAAGSLAAEGALLPPLLAQVAPVTAINDRGARAATAGAATPDSFTIQGGGSGRLARPPAAKMGSMSIWELIQQGGWAMYPLGFLSVIAVMLVVVYTFTLRRSAILTPDYMNTADVLLKKRDYLGLLAISSRHTEAVARVVQRTLDFATKNPSVAWAVIEDIAQTEGSAQANSLQHRVTYLADIGVISPMVGLLGTVVGIINAFGQLANGDASVGRDIGLAGGVSTALIATSAGLILGIAAMFFYALFRNRVQSLISDMEIASSHLLGLMALSFTKKRDQARVPVEDEF